MPQAPHLLAVPHLLDIPAILLAIFLALRKSDVRSEDPARHPRVALADFDRWRAEALRAYSFGVYGCFAKVVADFVFLAVLERIQFNLTLQRVIGVSLDVSWFILLGVCWYKSRKARRFASSVGIDVWRAPTDVSDQA
jgi:hypothetical protein